MVIILFNMLVNMLKITTNRALFVVPHSLNKLSTLRGICFLCGNKRKANTCCKNLLTVALIYDPKTRGPQ